MTRRIRREPPAFRQVEVVATEDLTAHLTRVVLGGEELDGFDEPSPAASVRLLLPPDGESQVVMPTWNGNEFVAADGSRPAIRTLTPRYWDPALTQLTVDIVLHDSGPLSAWVRGHGHEAAVSGPGRGFTVDPDVGQFVLAGDETSIPAIGQLLEHIPRSTRVTVAIEVSHADARAPLPDHPSADVTWIDRTLDDGPGQTLAAHIEELDMSDGVHLWAAGEAAAMQRIRRHLFDDRGWPRSRTTIRGYWKTGRHGDDAE